MLSFRNLITVAILAAILGVGAFYLHQRSKSGEPVGAGKTAANVVAVSGEAAKPSDAPPAPAPAAVAPTAPADAPAPGKHGKGGGKGDKENQRMHDIPVSPEHPAKGLKIPYFDNDGKLQMVFIIGVATRLDADHIDMSDMQVETFDDQQQHEMYIDLPTSVLDLNTSIISTKKHVTIRREDFILTGETMEFNTKTKQGGLGGSVKMLIYNLDNQTPNSAPETATPSPAADSAALQPASESKAP